MCIVSFRSVSIGIKSNKCPQTRTCVFVLTEDILFSHSLFLNNDSFVFHCGFLDCYAVASLLVGWFDSWFDTKYLLILSPVFVAVNVT